MKENKVRQIAAIMFTDIVGYSALMHGDEELATSIRQQHRDVFDEQHELHHGQIIQYYGDGTLSVFKSAIECVECAIKIQLVLMQANVPLRIGLHMGDIVFNNTEVYGDGVNTASRIEGLSVAGSILLSAKLNDEIKNHHAISTVGLGNFKLKNISNPIEIFAVDNEGITVPEVAAMRGTPEPDNKTIAVLPFVNMSASQENEYFSDGITEEIINALSKIKTLRVTSRTSSFFFKNKNIPIKQIGTDLNVSTILEGSVRLSGNTIRITAQLIQAEKDFHFWSETWDRKLENIFEIQDEISVLIAERLREHLGHFEIEEHLVQKQTDNLNTYELFLKARFHFRKWNPIDIKIAIGFYEQAIGLDPNHAESILGLADCYSFLATTGFLPFEEAWKKAAALTQKGLKLNDQLADGYYQLANLHFFTKCDYSEALKSTLKAIEINPNYVEAQQYLSFLYIMVGEKDLAFQHLKIALEIDPLSQETLFFSSYFDYMNDAYSEALEKLNRVLDHNPKNIPAHTVKCYCLLKLERYDEVINYFEHLPNEIQVPGEKLVLTALAHALKKDFAIATKFVEEIIKHGATPDGFRTSYFLFLIYAALGENNKAFEWVENAIRIKSPLLLIHFVDPLINSLKTDPRYAEYQKIIFPDRIIKETKKRKKELLDVVSAKAYSSRLLDYINKNKPYLDSNLSLRSLASQIDIHPNQLSWLLNENIGKNFNDFINHYRVNTFKTLSKDPKNSHLTLMGLAYDSGFNSKTVFNTSFKKETGLTPKQFSKAFEV